jgi:hypothetical protein
MIENLAKKTMIFVSWIVVLFLSNTVSYWGQATHHFATEERSMPLFEIETDNHIIITWANDEQSATSVVHEAYPDEEIRRLTKRPRDTWVISKSALGLAGNNSDPCNTARDCLAKASGDKVHAIRLYMHETGADLERSRKVIESNMVAGNCSHQKPEPTDLLHPKIRHIKTKRATSFPARCSFERGTEQVLYGTPSLAFLFPIQAPRYCDPP